MMKSRPLTNLRFAVAFGILMISASAHAQFLFQEEGYRWNPENTHVYRLTPTGMTWENAQAYARNHAIGGLRIPGNLVTIRSQSENNWLIDPNTGLQSPFLNKWIGMTDDDRFSNEGIWVWASGEAGIFNANTRFCNRYCNFPPGVPGIDSVEDFATIQDTRGNSPGAWFVATNSGSDPEFPPYGIVEFVSPFVGAFEDTDGNLVPEAWEDNNENGIPDGFENGGPFPAARNLRAGGGVGSIRLVWDPADSEDLLGYNIYRAQDPSFTQPEMINLDGPILDPVFIDGVDNGKPLEEGAQYYYQVESILNIKGIIEHGYSEIVPGRERQFVVNLPDLNAFPKPGEPFRYPISVLNARGLVGNGFEMDVTYPTFIQSVSVERTPLTRNFPELQWTVEPDKNQINFSSAFNPSQERPLIGEGALVNLVFTMDDSTPVGDSGPVEVTQAFFHIGPGVTGGKDLSDTGSITKRQQFIPGDIDGSGDLSSADVVACASLAFGVVPSNPARVAAGDINGDGVADISDVNQIIGILVAQKKLDKSPQTDLDAKGTGNFEIKLKDTSFSTLPGSVDMEVDITMPPAESEGIAGAAFTVSYATDYVQLDGVELDGSDFDVLFYDQRDYSRGWKPGRVKVIVSSANNKVINGEVAKVKFSSVGSPPVPSSDVPFVSGKLAKASGEDIAWNSLVDLEEGTLIFSATSGLDINVYVDNIIDARDLMIFLDSIGAGTQSTDVLNEFSKEWHTPR
ncbi:MAG: hypothetical protein KC944_19470 [Candidatus Omnitrophica bacterium]|nr:hypothetical protein [Candidatus Omnitrophota bacterium]